MKLNTAQFKRQTKGRGKAEPVKRQKAMTLQMKKKALQDAKDSDKLQRQLRTKVLLEVSVCGIAYPPPSG